MPKWFKLSLTIVGIMDFVTMADGDKSKANQLAKKQKELTEDIPEFISIHFS